ncbi:MAG: serine hydrolase [Planctomycetota bacterium]
MEPQARRRTDPRSGRIALLALAGLSGALAGQSLPDADLAVHGLSTESIASLRADLQKWCGGPDLAGMRVLLLHRGEVVLRGDFGRAPEPGTITAGSSSVPIYGLGAAIAVEHGLLDLSQPISFYLPVMTGTPQGSMTVQDLLTQGQRASAGRRRARRDPGDPTTTLRTSEAPLRSEVLLPAILSSATGIAVERWLTDRVLSPCQLSQTVLTEDSRATTTTPLQKTLRMETTLDDLARFTLLHTRTTPILGVNAEHLARLRGEVGDDRAGAPGQRAIGYFRERTDAAGRASTVATLGGTVVHCWTDLDLDLVGVVQFTRPPRSPQFLQRLRERTRSVLGGANPTSLLDWSRAGPETVEDREIDSRVGAELHQVGTRLHLPTDRTASALVILLPTPATEALATELAAHLASHGHAAATMLVTPQPMHRDWRRRHLHVAGSAPPELPIEKRAALQHRNAELQSMDRVDVLLDRAIAVRNAIRSLRNERRIPREPATAVVGFGTEVRTALLLGGAELTTADRVHSAPEPSVRAILAIAPPSLTRLDMSPQELARLGTALFVATRADENHEAVGGLGLAPRSLFDFAPNVQKHLVADIPPTAFEVSTDPSPPLIAGRSDEFDDVRQGEGERELLLGSVTAFLESSLRATDSAERWLEASIVAHPRRIARVR